jgi:predicted nucleic-acid-binding protein
VRAPVVSFVPSISQVAAPWLDTNAILRYLTDSPRDQALHVQRVMRRAEDGQQELVLDALIVAEIVWILTSSIYNFSMEEIATNLIPFLISDKLQIPERDLVISAIELARDMDVDFIEPIWLCEHWRPETQCIHLIRLISESCLLNGQNHNLCVRISCYAGHRSKAAN